MNNKSQMKELLTQYKNGEVTEEDMMKKLMVKQQLPQRPYFRTTKSRAIALYGVRRDPIVLYRPQWLRLSRVFSGGKKCVFNKFFFNEVEEKKTKKEEVDELLGDERQKILIVKQMFQLKIIQIKLKKKNYLLILT